MSNPFTDQRALLAADAFADLSSHDVLSITGPDRLNWLDSLTSQRLTTLTPGESAETLLLDPSGRIEYAARVVDDGETTWLLMDAGTGAGLAEFLQRMRFMLRVEVADRTADFATVGGFGVAPQGAVVTWHDPWSSVVAGGWQYAADEPDAVTDWTWSESLVPRDALPAALAPEDAAEALRIAARRPRAATEPDATTIPHELDWLRSAVHLSKGCYRGQETIAKVHNLGHPPRRLVLLHLDGSEGGLPAHDDAVLLGDATVGRITAAARHFELGPIALAIVKRTTDPSAALTVRAADGDLAAAQEVIVPVDAGATAGVPRLPASADPSRFRRSQPGATAAQSTVSSPRRQRARESCTASPAARRVSTDAIQRCTGP
ncbi:folate-binding protein [Pseudolysinimonas kribbensis]|uniref:Folate-binding protein n=1 Tax=Pseudolysinimonas kribbensis TaxID=433641 RepID=A0ABQ6K948_9MICO|nr:folate-binding protein [Pseudolysinimonas kribbensis]